MCKLVTNVQVEKLVEKEVVEIEEKDVQKLPVEVPVINKEKKDNKSKSKTVQTAKSTTIKISEVEFLKAMKKIKGEIRITNLYLAYNKKSKIFTGHVSSVVKTKIRNFGKTLVKKNIISMKKDKKGFLYTLNK